MAVKNAFYAQSGGVTSVINASAAGVIETAREVITGPLDFGSKRFDQVFRALRQWGRRPDAALWYGLCWVEGVRG